MSLCSLFPRIALDLDETLESIMKLKGVLKASYGRRRSVQSKSNGHAPRDRIYKRRQRKFEQTFNTDQ